MKGSNFLRNVKGYHNILKGMNIIYVDGVSVIYEVNLSQHLRALKAKT